MKKSDRFQALLLCALLLLSLLPLPVRAEDGVVEISSRADWQQLVRDCRLDSWSQGKLVYITEDLDLSGCAALPSFGGTLDGQGHRLQGLRLRGEGDRQGLLRELREGGTVRNLSLTGVVSPGGKADCIGGFVGENRGRLENCRFLGVVTGSGSCGGIVGRNLLSGSIVDCEMISGAVSGEHFVGGIVGENYGSVQNCVNCAQINTEVVEPNPQLSNVDWNRLNSVENVPASTDVGGVAGFSKGLLQQCCNTGSVGYPHLGYNVGGIAGRQAGLLLNCSNRGSIQGRKDVGGIVGQAEPFTELRYEEDTLDCLSRELDVLSQKMDRALDSSDVTRQALSQHISSINEQTGKARESISGLLDDLEEVGEGSVDTVNDLSGRVRDFMQDLERVTREMERGSNRLQDGLSLLRKAAKQAGTAQEPLEQAADSFQRSLDQLNAMLGDLAAHVPSLYASNYALSDLEEEELQEGIDGIRSLLGILSNIAKDGFGSASKEMQSTSESLKEAGKIVQEALKDMEDALWEMRRSAEHLSSAFDSLSRAISAQNELPKLELPKLPEDFHERENALRDTLAELNAEMERMNETANSGGDTLSQRLKDINRQFTAVTDVIRTAGDDLEDRELVVDLSPEEAEQISWGKVQDCSNRGCVEGDVNVGGIGGAMAIEYDFDPEDDVEERGDPSLNFRYLTRAIFLNCRNEGTITARKDAVGGIVGRMDLGLILGAQSYGDVKSSSGAYVGGIAGSSSAQIRDSWAKCALEGSRFVGGIAGMGQDILHCHSMVEIREGNCYLGAIAGKAEGSLQENRFVSPTLGGVDGISYLEKTRPLSFADLQKEPGLPEEFTTLRLRFVAGGKQVATLHLPFAQAVPQEQIPQVPPREGYYGSWAEFDRDCLLFDGEVEAVYTPWLSAAATEDGLILAEGRFAPGTVLLQEESQSLPPEVNPKKLLLSAHVSLPEGEQPFTALRVAVPGDCAAAELWRLREDGSWEKLNTSQESSYLRAELTGEEATLCLLRSVSPALLLWGLLLLAGVAGLLLLLYRRKKKKPAKVQAEQKKQKNSSPKKQKELLKKG